MKLTLITDAKGELVAVQRTDGQTRAAGKDTPTATLEPSRGQRISEIDVPDDYAQIDDAAEFLARVKAHVRSR
jgi:hypothetical protein